MRESRTATLAELLRICAPSPPKLTPRQQQVIAMALMMEGGTFAAIGLRLGIGEETVRLHYHRAHKALTTRARWMRLRDEETARRMKLEARQWAAIVNRPLRLRVKRLSKKIEKHGYVL